MKIMAKKIKLELTEAQFRALIDTLDTASSAMQECSITKRDIALVDRMLKTNGYKRNFT